MCTVNFVRCSSSVYISQNLYMFLVQVCLLFIHMLRIFLCTVFDIALTIFGFCAGQRLCLLSYCTVL